MTGGRLTRNINDLTVGYARARRDLGCRYTLGFYDRHPEADKQHRLVVDSRRRGVHLSYAARYTFPSQEQRKSMAVEAAYLIPQQFEGGGLRAHVFPLEPKDRKRWSAILVVDFPVEVAGAAAASTREFGVVVRHGTEVVHTFDRSISVGAKEAGSAASTPRVTFVEPVMLPPGTYALTAVLADPKGDRPFGRAVDLTLPPIPKREAILAGPILGRRRGDDVVVYGGGDAKGVVGDRLGARASFRPLLIDDVDRAEPLAALTEICAVRAKSKDGPWTISRHLETARGEPAGSLTDVSFHLTGGDLVQCQRLFDELPVPQLKPGRYTFRAVLVSVGQDLAPPTEGTAPFAVASASPN